MKPIPRILIITPFRNSSHVISQYLKALKSLTYPKDKIDLYWLENDSSDNTYKLLEQGVQEVKDYFHDISLRKVNIMGKQPKKKLGIDGKPQSICRDVPYGPKRIPAWLTIWNTYFLGWIRDKICNDIDFVLAWYDDCVPPPNVIEEYLKVFVRFGDAGWVGGAICRRYPYPYNIRCPMPQSAAFAQVPKPVNYIGHCWMMPKAPLRKMKFYNWNGISGDIHDCLIRQFRQQRFQVYYQPSVFLQHISTDGIIYCKELPKK